MRLVSLIKTVICKDYLKTGKISRTKSKHTSFEVSVYEQTSITDAEYPQCF